MIIQLEIEQFIKEIESKLPELNSDAKLKAMGKISVLNMASMEILASHDLARGLMEQRNKYHKISIALKCENTKYKKEIEKLLNVINGLEK